MKKLVFTTLVSAAIVITGCDGHEKADDVKEPEAIEKGESIKVKNSSIEETAETFVQAMIDADEDILNEVYRNPEDPLEYMLPDEGPEFSGLSLNDFSFEYEEDNEVQLERKDGEGPIYWIKIEMIGDKYFVTNM
jgi:hypothetical protein